MSTSSTTSQQDTMSAQNQIPQARAVSEPHERDALRKIELEISLLKERLNEEHLQWSHAYRRRFEPVEANELDSKQLAARCLQVIIALEEYITSKESEAELYPNSSSLDPVFVDFQKRAILIDMVRARDELVAGRRDYAADLESWLVSWRERYMDIFNNVYGNDDNDLGGDGGLETPEQEKIRAQSLRRTKNCLHE